MKKTILALSMASALMMTSCATIVSGTTQKVSFNSTPAKVHGCFFQTG